MEDLTPWKVIGWLAGVLGVGALIAGYFSDTVRQLLPTPRKIARWMQARDLPPAAGLHFTVLIADLKRDVDGSQTDHVAAALAPYKAIDVLRVGPGPEWDFGSRTTLEEQARKLLADKRGNVLIFGEVAKPDERLRLYLLGGHEPSEMQFRSYALETAELPKDFSDDFNAILLEHSLFLDGPSRLAKRLVHLAEVFGKPAPDGIRIDIHLSQQQLGNMVGMSRESMNKQLRQWREQDLIRVQEGPRHVTWAGGSALAPPSAIASGMRSSGRRDPR